MLEVGAERPYLEAALRAEQWIRSTLRDNSALWAPVPPPGVDTFERSALSLYHGAPGVIAFYLELYAATSERRFLDEAVRGAKALSAAANSATDIDAGLYTGTMGVAWILYETHRASGDEELLKQARTLVSSVATLGRREGWWSDSTDIVSGSAGIILGLLQLRELAPLDQAIEAAHKAAEGLLSASVAAPDGHRMWYYSRTTKPGPDARELPNFSHGTAGIAFALARLSGVTGDRSFLDAALDGAEHLKALASPSGDGFVIRHNSLPSGENLFYLSWCHGAPGTSRLWIALNQMALETRGARGVIAQGVPEKRTPGFWNNISMCCGNAGVAEYFLGRYRRSGDAADLAYAKRHVDDILARATVEGDVEKWIQAENRVSPNEVLAQTGWMQGAAGVGAMLLHMDGAQRKRAWTPAVWMPDALS